MSLESVEYSDRVYEMRPVGWLVRAIRSIFGRPYRWEDSVMNRDTFIRNVGVRSRLLGSILFVLRHPMRALDRLALPVYERWQMLRGTYGIAIYVARKT